MARNASNCYKYWKEADYSIDYPKLYRRDKQKILIFTIDQVLEELSQIRRGRKSRPNIAKVKWTSFWLHHLWYLYSIIHPFIT